MGIAAIEGYEHSNGRAMDLWEEVRIQLFFFLLMRSSLIEGIRTDLA